MAKRTHKQAHGSIFQTFFDDMPDGKVKQWFKKKSEEVEKVPETQIVTRLPGRKVLPTSLQSVVGNLWLFNYNPKTRKDLPYYDRLPLVLIIALKKDGFLGLNFHYLPIEHRLRFFEKLKLRMNTEKLTGKSRLLITYEVLSENMVKYREFLPCIKFYNIKNVVSNFIHIPPQDWDIAMLLPFYRFKKKPVNYVWKESLRIMHQQLKG